MDIETIDLTSVPESPTAARSSLDTLRSQRVAGEVTESDYLGRSDYLARLAAGEKDVEAPPDPYPTQDEQYARQLDEIFEPAEPHEYELPTLGEGGNVDAIDLEFDTAIREAMSEGGIPKQYGPQIVEIADGLLRKFKDASPEDMQAHYDRVNSKLRDEWGEDYNARVDAVDKLVANLSGKHEIVAALLDNAPYVFSDVWIMNSLWNVAQQRNPGK